LFGGEGPDYLFFEVDPEWQKLKLFLSSQTEAGSAEEQPAEG